MHLVNRHRRLQRLLFAAARHPIAITPFIREVPDDGGRLWRSFGMEGKRVCFVNAVIVVTRYHMELVGFSLTGMWDKNFPYTGISDWVHRMAGLVPAVKTTGQKHALRIRSPHRKVRTGHVVDDATLRAQLLVQLVMAAFV